MDKVFVPSTWKRLIAHFIDQMIRVIFYLPFIKVFYLLIFTDDEVHISFLQLGLFLLIPAIYEMVFLMMMQATPGKWLLGLKVVPFNNPYEKLDWQQCVLRPLVQRLSLFFSLAIYALAFFRYDRTHLADWVAETRVVQFNPRINRPRIRWFVGTLFLLFYIYEGIISAQGFLKTVDFKTKTLNVRALVDTEALDELMEQRESGF
ncbi:RDD family protein [Bdellovibrio reynosensis]|uniref:RDD family protein n=1 Tax=Bdellovibrio reynosensis TaxID=2835041 RepID=A0ABY4CBC6_9BACT|nr:RDD family protein [Bdellovibrio reynosensis]UOF02148.1 RDD family protein [Bdellovibrio reynosensis]